MKKLLILCGIALSSTALHPTRVEVQRAPAGIRKPMRERPVNQSAPQYNDPYYNRAMYLLGQVKQNASFYAPFFVEQAIDNLTVHYHQVADKGTHRELQGYMVRIIDKAVEILGNIIVDQERINAQVDRGYKKLRELGITDRKPTNHLNKCGTEGYFKRIDVLQERRAEVLRGNPSTPLLDKTPVTLSLPQSGIVCDVSLAGFCGEMPENADDIWHPSKDKES